MGPIHDAVRSANATMLRRVLESGVSPDAIDGPFRRTPLHLLCDSYSACMNGDRAACFTILREAGANLEATSSLRLTPLHEAAVNGRPELLSLLIQSGVNVNATCIKGKTALHFAAASGNAAMVKMLLEHQADPTLQNEFQETALHRAIRSSPNGEMTGEAARLLVEAKQGLLLQDYQGKTPAHLCEEKGWWRTLQLLETLGAGLQAIPKAPPKATLKARFAEPGAA